MISPTLGSNSGETEHALNNRNMHVAVAKTSMCQQTINIVSSKYVANVVSSLENKAKWAELKFCMQIHDYETLSNYYVEMWILFQRNQFRNQNN